MMTPWSDRQVDVKDRRSGMVVGLAGFARSGKDTVGQILVDNHNFARISFATPVYNGLYAMNPIVTFQETFRDGYLIDVEPVRVQTIVNKLGWEKAKVEYPEIRNLLQKYGTEGGREIHGQECWVNLACAAIKAAPTTNFVVTDVRFENELYALQALGGLLVKVTRPGISSVNGHVSDQELPDRFFNHFIRNNGSPDDFMEILAERVNEMVREKSLIQYTTAGGIDKR